MTVRTAELQENHWKVSFENLVFQFEIFQKYNYGA